MTALNRIPLSALRAADAVARLGTLGQAAEELGISIGAVSQRIAKAEATLGVSLFHRDPRGMRLTEVGAALAPDLAAGFGHLARAVDLASRDKAHTLIVSVAPIFASRWLVHRLPGFYAQHPDIRVRIDSAVGLVDPNTSDVDLCLRIGHGPYPEVRAERLFDQRVMPVCAPDMAERLKSPADLASVPIVRDVNAAFSWADWLGPEGLSAEILGPGPEFSDGSLAFYAAMGGAGVYLTWETLDIDALKSGRIVAPFGERRHKTGQAYWLVSARDSAPGIAQRAFTRWMKAELQADGVKLC
ncbi:LysR substrate-binding domain-containing protein [Maritimibacter dapengensis]|uniref:LysR family transcriptional regulator n=1 Tax=Maritimibacter dapengensis TaxID=2836868 RepID=A0ABS6T7X1_9RHOB|nr:LysR substrate-binding domain-containing protein [Maritimibacter dapengensis]MBV7380447.1 LysR family transcriptional regulator [Maritimibacter dapengensis]